MRADGLVARAEEPRGRVRRDVLARLHLYDGVRAPDADARHAVGGAGEDDGVAVGAVEGLVDGGLLHEGAAVEGAVDAEADAPAGEGTAPVGEGAAAGGWGLGALEGGGREWLRG